MGYLSVCAIYLLIKNHPLLHRAAKFLLVGGSGFLIEVALMQIFVDGLGFEKDSFYILTNAGMFLLNFVLSDNFVFRDSRASEPKLRKRFIKFTLAKGTGLLLNLACFIGTTMIGASTFWATFAGGIVGMVFNFFASNRWVYGPSKTARKLETTKQTEPGT